MVCVVSASRAGADVQIETPEWSLSARCGAPGTRLASRVRRLVSPGEWASGQTVVVTVTPSPVAARLDVVVRIDDEALRRAIPSDERCNVMLAAISVVVAVALTEPESLAPVDEVLPPMTPVAPVDAPPVEMAPVEIAPVVTAPGEAAPVEVEEAPVEEEPADEPASEARPRRPARYALGMSVESVTELADLAVPGASLSAYGPLGPLRWDLVLAFRATRARTIAAGWDAEARFLGATARGGACAPFARPSLTLFACLGLELGVVHGAAPRAKSSDPGTGYTLATELEARVSIPSEARVHATFFGGVAIYPLRTAFEVLNEGRVYTTPVVAATLGVRLERSWP
jgi:hypothetical protein